MRGRAQNRGEAWVVGVVGTVVYELDLTRSAVGVADRNARPRGRSAGEQFAQSFAEGLLMAQRRVYVRMQ